MARAPEEDRAGPREARRRQRIDLSRGQILDTAERLFNERGYHGTGLKDVAELSEFSVGSIYSFFEGKEHLYEEVLMRRGPAQMAEMRRVAAGEGPADDRLIAMASLQIEYFRRYPAWGRLTTRVLTSGDQRAAALPARFREAYREAITLEAELFAQGQREGVLRQGNPRALARLFSAMVTAYHEMDPEIGGDADGTTGLAVEEFLALVGQAFTVSRRD